jgi:ribose/xylose/arabinose/galactoside ABC-type transport system permease subunit
MSTASTAVNTMKTAVQRVGPMWFAVVILYIVSGLITPGMFSLNQVSNIFQITAFLGIVAIGQTIVLLTGGIDLSVSGVVTLVNVVLALTMDGNPQNVASSVALCLFLSVVVGLVNGVLITSFSITPLIVTLAMNSLLFGIALVVTGGIPRGSVTPAFAELGQGYILGIPLSTVNWLIIALIMGWVTQKTVFGRRLYAVGANPVAAHQMGVRVNRILIAAYILSSLMAGLAGLLLTAYINLPSLGIGDQFLFASIAAAVVGGASLRGGIGTILGCVGGALFITILNSFTNIVRVPPGVQFFLQGFIIAASVVLYRTIGGGDQQS